MYSITGVQSPEDILPFIKAGGRYAAPGEPEPGVIGCHYSGCIVYYSGSKDVAFRHWSHVPAKTAWVSISDTKADYDYVALLCGRHTGTVKSLISRGAVRYEDFVLVADNPADLAEVAKDPAGTTARERKVIEDARAAAKVARAAKVAEDAPGVLIDHLKAATYAPDAGANAPDEYGRVWVMVPTTARGRLTPAQARAFADSLHDAAGRAEKATKDALAAIEGPFAEKMMPGQEPYTPAERAQRNALVAAAAAGDPGEQGEIEGKS